GREKLDPGVLITRHEHHDTAIPHRADTSLSPPPGTEHVHGGIASAEFDISWPDGRPVQTGLSRFCNLGSRLLFGHGSQVDTALVRLTVSPAGGLGGALTRPGRADGP